jgi:hypothetical protein
MLFRYYSSVAIIMAYPVYNFFSNEAIWSLKLQKVFLTEIFAKQGTSLIRDKLTKTFKEIQRLLRIKIFWRVYSFFLHLAQFFKEII